MGIEIRSSIKDGILCLRHRLIESIKKPLGDLVGTLDKQTISNKFLDSSNTISTNAIKYNYVAVSSDYVLKIADDIIEVTDNSVSVTLLAASKVTNNKPIRIKNSSITSATLDVENSGLIDDETFQTLAPDTSISVFSNGTQWKII